MRLKEPLSAQHNSEKWLTPKHIIVESQNRRDKKKSQKRQPWSHFGSPWKVKKYQYLALPQINWDNLCFRVIWCMARVENHCLQCCQREKIVHLQRIRKQLSKLLNSSTVSKNSVEQCLLKETVFNLEFRILNLLFMKIENYHPYVFSEVWAFSKWDFFKTGCTQSFSIFAMHVPSKLFYLKSTFFI